METLGLLKSPVLQQVFSDPTTYGMVQPIGNTFVTTGICGRCNNGAWWQEIDENAEALKVDLARRSRRYLDLTNKEREDLGLWTVKACYAAMAMGLSRNKVCLSHLHRFYQDRCLPENSAVFMLDADLQEEEFGLGSSDAGIWLDIPTSLGTSIPGYKHGLRIGSLYVAFIHCTARGFNVSTPPMPDYFRVLAKTGVVSDRYSILMIDHEVMQHTSLNFLVSNLSCQPRNTLAAFKKPKPTHVKIYNSLDSLPTLWR